MKRIPIIHLVLVAVLWAFFTFIFSKLFFDHGEMPLADLIRKGLAYNIFLAALTVLVYSYIRPANIIVGLNKIKTKKNWILIYPIFIIVLALTSSGLNGAFSDVSNYGWFFINCIFVGISEELMFRGILLSSLTKKIGFWKAAIIVIVLFGLIHVLNVFTTGDLNQGLLQAVTAMSSGILFLAIRVKTLSIIPAIIIHWFWDFTAFTLYMPDMNSDNLSVVNYLGLGVGLLVTISPLIFGVTGIIQLMKKPEVEAYVNSQNEAK